MSIRYTRFILTIVLVVLVFAAWSCGPKSITIEDNDSSFSWAGNWEMQNNQGASGGTWHATPPQGQAFTPGAKATVTFTGTGVSLVYVSASHCGIVDINIDGTSYGKVDMYSPDTKTKVKKVIATNLSEGQHVITITATDSKNPSSTGNVVAIDAIEVTE